MPRTLPPCERHGGAHPAELIPGENFTYIYAAHADGKEGAGGGGWQVSCAAGSGICHGECWPHERDPDLRGRIVTGLVDGAA